MAVTRVSICNAALRMIGERVIASFDEDTELAEHCRDIYDQTRRSILRDHPWSCARKRTILSPVSTHPSFGYNHAFPLPKDYILIVDPGTNCYEVESRHILANTNKIRLVYIFDNDNEDTWDSMLSEAMSLKLASKMCKPITGSDAAGETAEYNYQKLIKRARSVNAQERPSQDMQYADSSYLGDRY
ncbi:hypothetical protein L313_2807 [Acinetobacter haemolyticus CIP 64.3 = MTCC 9819]|uniref:Uncharacterized protein n=1 Tax=Acinetobacter haemolyticus CIP 64.3 = MTCC 9819 TaxID=1217659 RepID=N9GEU9_ACIHA|nr:hypothetical protein [Acinetobacter haemolyticus]ENW15624.1 hypothetical protein F927_03364 [Acinetobacter haemolyticus CIP 64.3 = MTCC 9819]EPR90397.1 hypothetical protein L313_2807 [Acinetobacter haemolyticus CIP 64.3 = MTCC 9819]QXZ26464.1 hypothetical protein I6L22_15040 [Acinetobacter haemolyticus]SPT48653.1 phage-like protein [Acinetobacter haemolyticus]SUU61788.1 phage-like protein [Acinetobacter haemolyticus]